MIPLFLSQKIAAKDPEKNIPSTAANATTLYPYADSSSLIHRIAQSAFFLTHGMVSMALKRYSLRKEHNYHIYSYTNYSCMKVKISFSVKSLYKYFPAVLAKTRNVCHNAGKITRGRKKKFNLQPSTEY